MRDLVRSYLLNFVKPEVVNSTPDITKVDFKNPDHQKSDEDLGIGAQTSRFLRSLEDELDNAAIDRFFK